MDRRLVEILQANKKLQTGEEIKEFREALKELRRQDLDDSLLSELLLAFDDHVSNIEILEGLCNLVFRFDTRALANVLTRMTEELNASSPKWLRHFYTRSLQDEEARLYIRKNLSSLPIDDQQAIRDVLRSIATNVDKFEDPEITKDIQDKVNSILN